MEYDPTQGDDVMEYDPLVGVGASLSWKGTDTVFTRMCAKPESQTPGDLKRSSSHLFKLLMKRRPIAPTPTGITSSEPQVLRGR